MTVLTSDEIAAVKELLRRGMWMIPPHMRAGTTEYVKRGREVGGFLSALFSGDIGLAERTADSQNSAALTDGRWQRFVIDHMPEDSHGSRAKFEAWKKAGGLKGMCKAGT